MFKCLRNGFVYENGFAIKKVTIANKGDQVFIPAKEDPQVWVDLGYVEWVGDEPMPTKNKETSLVAEAKQAAIDEVKYQEEKERKKALFESLGSKDIKLEEDLSSED